MTTTTLIDETTRPKAPPIEGLDPFQELRGKRLAFIHQMHLQELDRTRQLMHLIEAGERRLAELGEAVSSLQMVESYRAFGNLCGRECQMLTFHHMAEDQLIFPALDNQGSEGLRKVVQRLREEHEVIHSLLVDLETRAAAAVARADAESFAELKQTFDTLDRTVRSHFGYEQTELEQALGYYDVEV